MPGMTSVVKDFVQKIAGVLKTLNVIVNDFLACCINKDFIKALNYFEEKRVDAIVTLHLEYSPSLESAGILSKSRILVVVFNTTPSKDFGPSQNPSEIMYNHGKGKGLYG